MKRGVIINPKSGRRRKGIELARLLEPHAQVMVRMLDDFTILGAILDEMAASGVDEIFLSSGDGTVQAVQSDLAERRPFATLPKLGLLPHGTTNMTAADLGLGIRSLAAQAAFIAGAASARLKTSPTIKVANPADAKVRHGMFLGTGAVTPAVRFCQDAVHRSGLAGDWAAFATLTSALASAMLGRGDPNDAGRIDKPYSITVRAGDETIAQGNQLLLLVSTLDRLILGTHPFWGGRHGPLRVMLLPYPVPSILRWVLPLMYGGEKRRVPEGAVSWSGERLTVETPMPFVIDGEFFEAPAATPLRIEIGPVFTYICG